MKNVSARNLIRVQYFKRAASCRLESNNFNLFCAGLWEPSTRCLAVRAAPQRRPRYKCTKLYWPRYNTVEEKSGVRRNLVVALNVQ